MKRKKQADADEFLTPYEAMRILKIGRAAFYGMIVTGKIPGAIKVGNQWRINPRVFWAAMEERSAGQPMTEAQRLRRKRLNAGYHRERMASDLKYRMRKLLNTIRARCLSGKGRKDWEWYGGKGITVSITVDELVVLWRRDRADLMERPSIDRKDHDKGYEFENCRFIEHAENVKQGTINRRPRRWYRKPIEAVIVEREKGNESDDIRLR